LTQLIVDPDPLDLGDPGVPEGHSFWYQSDLWGSGTHNELYLVTKRQHSNLDSGGAHSLWIYNLNDLPSDTLKIYESVDFPGGWTSEDWLCDPDETHPEVVAGCYRPETVQWSPTGDAIYVQDMLREVYLPTSTSNWEAALRLNITRGVPSDPISTWGISAPEIVYAGSATETSGRPAGISAMPRPGLAGIDDLIFQHRSPPGILDVNACVSLFATLSIEDLQPDLWLDCLEDRDPVTNSLFDVGGAGMGSWQSSHEILHERGENVTLRNKRERRQLISIYRTNIYDGVSTKLIEDARYPDTGN